MSVYDEGDGHLLWSRSITYSYGEPNAVVASNNRIYIKSTSNSGVDIQVLNAKDGLIISQKHCNNCKVEWSQVYGQGWMAKIRDYTNSWSLWLHDEHTNATSATPSPSWELNTEEQQKIKTMFFGGLTPSATTPSATLSNQCLGVFNHLNTPQFYKSSPDSATCYVPPFSDSIWSVTGSIASSSLEGWQTQLVPLEANNNVLYVENGSIYLTDAITGNKIWSTIMPSEHSFPMARSKNLLFIGGDRIDAIDLSTRQTVWSIPYPGTVMGISNAGVLYVRLQTKPTGQPDSYYLAAINLR